MKNNIVYSTDPDFLKNNQPPQPAIKSNPNLLVTREKKHRAGKEVIVIKGFQEESATLKKILSQLKKICGSGGTIKDTTIEIQGNNIPKITEYLVSLGYKCKISGI